MLTALIDDPLTVGHRLALNVQPHAVPDSRKLGTHRRWSTADLDMFDVDPSGAFYGSGRVDDYGCLNVSIRDDDDDDGVPVYYLPWNVHQIYKIRLASLREPQPRLFFTDNLDGCAIIVEGITLMPNVYHANAAKELESYSPVADTSMLEQIALEVIDARNDVMFAACKAYPEDTSRSLLYSGRKWPLCKPAGAVTPREYAVLIGRPSERAEKRAALTNPVVLKPTTESSLFASKPKQVAPEFVHSRGAVFGVADTDGNWRFFVQKIVTLKGGKDLVLRCAEFWPGGFARLPW